MQYEINNVSQILEDKRNEHWIYRSREYICGKHFLAIEVNPDFRVIKRKRSKKEFETDPVQQNLNDKKSYRFLERKISTNFTKEDLFLTLTYANEFLPGSEEQADRILERYIDRLNYHSQKKHKKNIKYIIVTEISEKGRYHHHMFLGTKLSRDMIEDLWSTGRGKNKKSLGRANSRRLQPNERGFEEITRYVLKSRKKGKKSWRQSKGLIKPFLKPETNKSFFTKRQMEKYLRNGDIYTKEFWQKRYKGYYLAGDIDITINEVHGLPHIYIKMWKGVN